MVGTVRFELTTSCTPSKRATKLRYVPNHWSKESIRLPRVINHEDSLKSFLLVLVLVLEIKISSRMRRRTKNEDYFS